MALSNSDLSDLLDAIRVFGVRDPERHVHATFLLVRDVLDHIAPDAPVRDDEGLVVNRQNGRRNEAHVRNAAEHAGCLDHVTHVVRANSEDHHAGREVSE